PALTSDGGGAFTSDATNYLSIPDGGAGGAYDWTSGAWSVQMDFTFPATPSWGSNYLFMLASKGSLNEGTGWELQIENSELRGNYQIKMISVHGSTYHIVSAYLVVPGALNRALFVCDEAGDGTFYVNGEPSSVQPCAPGSSGASDLVIGRYS